MQTLLIVDDNEAILQQLKWGLKKTYNVVTAENAGQALALMEKHRPGVVTLDLGLPPDPDGVEEGFKCLGDLLALQPTAKVIVLTGKGEKENALKAVALGAYDFYPKPIDLGELKIILARAFHLSELEGENRRLAVAAGGGQPAGAMIGQSRQMQAVFSAIEKVSSSDVPVLILGESGTGKELAARAIHQRSLRASEAFVPINCGAIPENLLESELFGHEKGSFTGAQARVMGRVEYASKGTLFLDEIGELPASLQVKLLRFLQEKVIQRVGGREEIAADARIVAATNIDVKSAIAQGKLREDLYYRIGVVTIELPPLAQRGDDLLLLAHYFLNRSAEEYGKRIRGYSPSALQLMKNYTWPGNVRELENKVKRAVIMANGSILQPDDLGLGVETDAPPVPLEAQTLSLKEAKGRLELSMIAAALERNEGNVAKAADELGVSRPTLYDLMRKHGMRIDA